MKDKTPVKGRFVSCINMDPLWQKRTILIVVSLLSALIIFPKTNTSVYKYRIGEIARQNIKAPEDILVEDKASTKKKKEEAVRSSRVVYDFDEDAAERIKEKVGKAFILMREKLSEIDTRAHESLTEGGSKQVLSEIKAAYIEESRIERHLAFEGLLNTKVNFDNFRIIEKKGFTQEIENIIKEATFTVMKTGVVDNKEMLQEESEKGIIIRNVKSQAEKTVKDTSSFLGLAEARDYAANSIASSLDAWPKEDLSALTDLASSMIKPNLTLNKNESEKRKSEAEEAVSPVFFQIIEGEMILREGERVNKDHQLKLEALIKSGEGKANYLNILGLFFLISSLLYLVYRFSVENIRKVSLNVKDLTFLSTILLFTFITLRLSLPVTEALMSVFPYIPAGAYQYIFTVAVGSMLIRIVLNSETAIISSVVISIIAALIMKNSLFFGIYTFVGSVVGIQMVRYCKDRVTLIKAGFYVGLVNAFMVMIFGLAVGGMIDKGTLLSAAFGLLGGVGAGILVTGMTPIIEGLFNYTTNFKLLELASLDHPLLKELITQAPGTYHHSWIIGNLVENAAKAINANPLLARVSALYHDIGKTKKPQYFFENQKNGKNPHDKLSPSLSSLILIGHVKDGIELAREHKLGDRIANIIPQHHGTRLIKFFYNKAKELEDPEVHSVDEKDFRYPGPKPQTKEAGLVMLADAVEAATRTIQDPTPARIKNMVDKIIADIFMDGQLDECELTLKDLNEISGSFNRILNGIFHARIDYPEVKIKDQPGRAKIENSGRDKKEAQGSKKERNKKSSQDNSKTTTIH